MGPSGLFVSIFILIFLSTFFSLAETAIISAPEEKIFKMNQDGVLKAKFAMKILSNKEKIISIALLCDNLVNIAASSLSAVFFAETFGEFDEIGILLSTIIMTILIFVFGEVLPKMIALRQPTKITLFISPMFLLLWKVLYPIIWFVNSVTERFVKVLNIKNEEDSENADNSILGAVEMYHERGMLEKNEKEMLSGILHLDEIDMKDVMTNRGDVFAIDINEDTNNIIEKMIKTSFTKVPFYDKSIDNIVGYIRVVDMMKELHECENAVIRGYKSESSSSLTENLKSVLKERLRKIMIKPWFLPGDSSVSKHLQEFKDRGNTIAFVVDEFGGIMGIATLEDVLEEIVGDINRKQNLFKVKDNTFIVRADVSLPDVNEVIGSKFENSEVSTIGGFLLDKIEKIPKKGETFYIDGYSFKILSATNTSIEIMEVVKKINDADDLSSEKSKTDVLQNNDLFVKNNNEDDK